MTHYRGGDGGASGAVYGSMGAATVGGVAVYGLISCLALIYVRLWPVTVPATVAYFGWYYPRETLQFIWSALVGVFYELPIWALTDAPWPVMLVSWIFLIGSAVSGLSRS